MIGAIAGDMIGSTREMNNVKTKDFELLPVGSQYTDDTVFSLAVAKWLMDDPERTPAFLVKCMQELGQPNLKCGFSNRTQRWLMLDDPQPMGSYGNGAAMRVSPIGLLAKSEDEVMELALISADVSHNHPDAEQGAQAVALAVYLAKNLKVKDVEEMKNAIKRTITERFGYNLDRTIDEIRPDYKFDLTCPGSVPESIIAYLESTDFEDAARNAVSIGGDSDTIASIACAIAHAQTYNPWLKDQHERYSIPNPEAYDALLSPQLREILNRLEANLNQ